MIILRNNSYYWHITKCYSGCKTEIRWFKKIIILIDDEKKTLIVMILIFFIINQVFLLFSTE